MIFSVLHGIDCKSCGDGGTLLGNIIPALIGDTAMVDKLSDLKNLKERILQAYKNTVEYKSASFKVPLTDNEIDRYASYGLNRYLLYVISPKLNAEGIPEYVGIEERDRELIAPDYEESIRRTAGKKLLSQIEALEEGYYSGTGESGISTPLILIAIALGFMVMYYEYSDKRR